MKRIYESPELQQIDLLSESLLITRVRDNFSMKRVPTALIFLHIPAAPPAYSQKSNMQ